MKKTFRFLFAAVAILSAASCAKELLEPEMPVSGGKKTISFSLVDEATKTSLNSGKTVWAENDTILLSDGSKTMKLAIPAAGVGESTCDVAIDTGKIDLSKVLYAVYPVSAYKSISATGEINVTVPNVQSGLFEEANICVAKADDYKFYMKNATAVLQVQVADDVETLMLNGGQKDTLAGALAVTYTKADTALSVKVSSPLKSIKVTTGGLGDTYYVAVAPGNYAEFSMLALSLDGKSQKKSTTGKSLKINDIANLGKIGQYMAGSSLEGSGSEDDPFLLKDVADFTSLATFVNNGLTYEGMYFKVTDDVEGVNMPIGTYDQVHYPFMGVLDGNNKTITLDMGGEDSAENYLGLFGSVGAGAVIKDLTLAGSVKTTGRYVAGLAAIVHGGAAGVTIKNITNNATVKGGNFVAGVVAWSDTDTDHMLVYDNLVNNGSVTAVRTAGGVVGYAVRADVTNCTNTGAVESTEQVASAIYLGSSNVHMGPTGGGTYNETATGGVVAALQNGTIKSCTNNGTVKAFFKVGGIAGFTYWLNVTDCTNNGTVTGTGSFSYNVASQMGYGWGSVAGGIVGWHFAGGTVRNCVNNAAVNGQAGIGGIAGFVCSNTGNSSFPTIRECQNNAPITSTGAYVGGYTGKPGTGGIVGATTSCMRGSSDIVTNRYPQVFDCTNTGKISTDKVCAGGIVGWAFETLAYAWGTTIIIDKCVNEGDVDALYWAGGIMGYSFSRYCGTAHINNSINHGTIAGTRSDADNGVSVGGILGCSNSNSNTYATNKDEHYRITNCYNDGDVVYSTASFLKPYIGGILGYGNYKGYVVNCVNAGYVGPADHSELRMTDAEAGVTGVDQYLGGIVGRQNFSACYYCYYADDQGIPAVGLSGTAARADNITFDVDGLLGSTATQYGEECSTLLQALKAWVKGIAASAVKTYGSEMVDWKAGVDGVELDM